MEITLKKFTEIKNSPKKITIPDDPEQNNIVRIEDLNTLSNFQRVTVNAKVINISKPTELDSGKVMPDITIADSTGTSCLTVWEKDVNKLKKNNSYFLSNVVVREYRSKKHLSMSKTGSKICLIDDIGNVSMKSEDDDDDTIYEINNATIVGVLQLDKYNSCLGCKARVETISPAIGHCTKCAMIQRTDKCQSQLSAKLIFLSNGETTILNVFNATLNKMVKSFTIVTSITQEDLLMCEMFKNIKYNSSNIITEITQGDEEIDIDIDPFI
jgi:hypothetical protein